MDETALGEDVRVLDLLRHVVLPVLDQMLEPGEEPEEVSVAWEGEPPSRGRSDLLLTVVVNGEVFRFVLHTHSARVESTRESRLRLASDLQDFIAESQFGRGQLRTYYED